mgnify:CR=1 FL=1
MPPDKAKKTALNPNTLEEVIFLLAGLLLLGALVSRGDALLAAFDSSLLGALWERIAGFFLRFWPLWKIIAILILISCVAWTTYSIRKLTEINIAEAKIFGAPVGEAALGGAYEAPSAQSTRWQRVVDLSNSPNSSDWRSAIIDADIILDELLTSQGYVGDGVGEKLKGVDKSDMLTLDQAWDAHKVRNQIAHGGESFQLNERETKRVISLFESVFRESRLI